MDIGKDELEELVSQLDIKVENIYHVVFTDDTEMVGEILSSNSEDEDKLKESFKEMLDEAKDDMFGEEELEIEIEYLDSDGAEISSDEVLYHPEDHSTLFLNPVKIIRDTWINPDGEMKHTNYFIEYNPCIEGPYIPIQNHSIKTINPPNNETLICYLKALYKIYYPLLSEIPDGNLSVISQTLKLNHSHLSVSTSKNVVDFTSYLKKRQSGSF
jgi:hypothetical protein